MTSRLFFILAAGLLVTLSACDRPPEALSAQDHFTQGVELAQLGQQGRAIAEIDWALELFQAEIQARRLGARDRYPVLSKIYYNRGLAYEMLGECQRAIDDYDGVMQRMVWYRQDTGVTVPELPAAYNNGGSVYLKWGQPAQAIDDYNETIKVFPQYAEAYANRGLAHIVVGTDEEAQRDFDRAVELGLDRAMLEAAMKEQQGNNSDSEQTQSCPTPATYTVNSSADAVDATPGDSVCDDGAGHCTLRAAIMEANILLNADTVTVPAGTYTLTLGSSLTINGGLTLNGAGAGSTVIEAATSPGVATSRVFVIEKNPYSHPRSPFRV